MVELNTEQSLAHLPLHKVLQMAVRLEVQRYVEGVTLEDCELVVEPVGPGSRLPTVRK